MTYSKIITLDDHFSTGEPTVQLVSTWGRNGRLLRENTSLHKIASTKSPAIDYIKNVLPEEGKTIVLVIGLGDSETYGANRNGDAFPSKPIKGKIDPDQVLTKHYQSYDKAHVFEHHVNGDPKKAIGRVKKAFWNPVMHRVELVEDFDNGKAPHLLEKIADGNYTKLAKSMGCVLADAPIVTTRGRVPAGEIVEGDTVLTHRGNWHKVFELHRRYYKGTLYSVRTSTGVSKVTHEHPYAVMRAEDVLSTPKTYAHPTRKKPKDIDLEKIQWMPAEALEVGDYLLTPFNAEVQDTLSVEECRLLGYYTGDGCAYIAASGTKYIEVTHNINNPALTELISLHAALDPESTISQYEDAKCADVIRTNIFSARLHDLCIKHAGRLSHHKKISAELSQQLPAKQLAFLGAYINCDGGGGIANKDDFYISSCNENLMYQIQQIGFRCGMYSRISTIKHKPSTIVNRHTVEYRADFSRKYCSIIAPFTVKVAPREMKSSSTGPIFVNNVVLSKIKDISVEPYEGPVFNFEVEVDNSYMANNHAVHNCRIKYDVCNNCSNRARTRAEYCDHLKYAMSRIDPHTGVQNSALNPSPDFFDSSWVMRPADRTGFMLKKVAKEHPYEIRMGSFELAEIVDDLNHKSAELGKAADIEKIIQGTPAASVSNLDPADARLVERYVSSCGDKPADEPDHSRSVRIMISYKPSEALDSANEAGLPLGLKDLIQFFLGKIAPELGDVDKPTLKAASDHLGLVYSIYSKYPRFYTEIIKEAGLDQDLQINTELVRKLASNESLTTDYLKRKFLPESMYTQRPRTDVVTWTDPNTGKQYKTNYNVIQKTQDPLIEHGLRQKAVTSGSLLGTGALLGGAAYALRKTPVPATVRHGTGLVGAGLGLLGAKKLLEPTRIPGPKVVTDKGETISGWTEMSPTSKIGSFKINSFAYVVKRAHSTPSNLTVTEIDAFLDQLKTAEVYDELSPILGPTLDLNKVAQALGSSILMQTE